MKRAVLGIVIACLALAISPGLGSMEAEALKPASRGSCWGCGRDGCDPTYANGGDQCGEMVDPDSGEVIHCWTDGNCQAVCC